MSCTYPDGTPVLPGDRVKALLPIPWATDKPYPPVERECEVLGVGPNSLRVRYAVLVRGRPAFYPGFLKPGQFQKVSSLPVKFEAAAPVTYRHGTPVRIGDRVLLTTPTHPAERDPDDPDPDAPVIREGIVSAVIRRPTGEPLVYVKFPYPHSQGGYGTLDGPPEELVLLESAPPPPAVTSPQPPKEAPIMGLQSVTIPVTIVAEVPVPALTFTPNPVPPPKLTVGVAMTPYSLGTAGGGVPPYKWSVDPNTPVAPGLSVDANGNLIGTITAAGSFSFNVILTDSSGLTLKIPVGR